MRLRTAIGTAALAAGLGFGGAVHAADMPAYTYPGAAETPAAGPLAFGSGWYLRGDASFGPEDKPKLLLAAPSEFDAKASSWGYGVGLGAGYRFNELLRVDVTGDYLDPFQYSAISSCGNGCTFSQQADVQRADGLVNGYLDLGTWWGISPYVGAGAGVGFTEAHGSIALNGAPLATGIVDPLTHGVVTSRVPSHTDYRFAWAGMAGFAYPLTPRMLLDVGYRYLDLGKTRVQLFPAVPVSRDITENQVRLGIRYMID